MPVLLHGIRVEAGHQHVVVEIVRPNAVLRSPMEVRRLLNPCRLPESRENRACVVVPRLCQYAVAYRAGYHNHLLDWEREAGRLDERFGVARKPLKSARESAENHDFGTSFLGSMNGFLTTTAVRNPAGVTISISVPSFER